MSAVLITGADGHLGQAMARWMVDHTDRDLVLWMRGGEQEQNKREAMADLPEQRCRLAFGDLADDQPFDTVDPASIDCVVHAAAVTQFTVPQDLAERVNERGSRKLFEWARSCPALDRVVLLSTLYTAGLETGVLDEQPLERPGSFANHYESSKWRAERILVDDYADLPWQIQRVATVMAEDETGRVVQQNVVHNTMRLLYYGLLSVVPGRPETRVYMTTTSYAAAACARLALDGADQQVYHVSDNGEQALGLGPLLDLVFDAYMTDADFRGLRILKPLFCDQTAFDALLEGTSQFSGVIGQSLGSVAPFAPQLFHDKNVRTAQATAALPDLAVPLAQEVLPRVCDHLVETRWGLAREKSA